MSLFSRFNPANIIPRFPPYLGPYAVGSFEVEIPVASLAPPGCVSGVAETVQFRVFYPTQKPAESPAPAQAGGWWGRADKKPDTAQEDPPGVSNSNSSPKPVRWLPEPHQREYLSAYARFLGASSGFAEIVSHISRLLHYISLPAVADAPLLAAPGRRFPTMIFSHGLGGTRLAYSHLCCSIASYGVVVIAPEHRDGSAPVSFVKTPPSSTSGAHETQLSGTAPSAGEPGIAETSAAETLRKDSCGRVQVDYLTYPHHVTDETANGRNRQLETRLREINLIYTALTKLDLGETPPGTMVSTDDPTTTTTTTPGPAGTKLLAQFQNRLDIHTPGRVIWAGHSFGASTMFQLVKTTYHTPPPEFTTSDFAPLFTPTSTLKQQITPDSPLMLLDLWCLPLLGKRTSHLFKQPLPQIQASSRPHPILVIMSEEFWKWKENLNGVRRVLSLDPGRKRGGPAHQWFEQWDDEHDRILTHSQPRAAPAAEQPTTPAPMGSMESSRMLEIGGQIVPPQGTTPAPTRPSSSAGVEVEVEEAPRFFYALKSAHLSQSDFGVLFPRAIRRAEEPVRILELNVRAAVQWLREAGFVLGGGEEGEGEGDKAIFEGEVEGWRRIGLEEVEEGVEGRL